MDGMDSIDDLSSRLVDELAALDPVLATELGIPGYDHLWPDMSPDGFEARRDLFQRYRWSFEPYLGDRDARTALAAGVLCDWLDERLRHLSAGEHFRSLRHIASPFQEIREIFDQMPKHTNEDWEAVASRLRAVGDVLGGYRSTLSEGIRLGLTAARRQVESVVRQAEHLAGPESAWNLLATSCPDDQLLDRPLRSAKEAVAEFARWLRDDYLPEAPTRDAVGGERYEREADRLVGGRVDPVETYEWGWEEIARIRSEMSRTAEEIQPGARIEEVAELLETDPDRAVHSPEDLVAFVENRLNEALERLDGQHFDVPDQIKKVTVHIAPPGGALGAYYLPPSEDFTRPGSVWYSVGSRRSFPVYQEVSTAYHEGFPGHHLQVGTAMVQADRLTRAHRLLVWYSGYGEGWALYAERVMEQLGFLEKPEYRFGYLASQILRAVRVVVDIGLHLELSIPEGAPLLEGRPWDYEAAVDYVERVALQPRDVAASEVTRYLGWPGQAISYKVGERALLDLRELAESRLGEGFDPRWFHRVLLVNGEMRLDRLRRLVLSEISSRAGEESDTG